MLLRQHQIRAEVFTQPLAMPDSRCFRLFRQQPPCGGHHSQTGRTRVPLHASAAGLEVGSETAPSPWLPLETAEDLRASPADTAAPASEWSIPPEQWQQHPTLLDGCERERAPLRVAVLLSGGVDSSLALRLAQAAGHKVTAFYLQIWFQEDFRNTWDACPWEEDLEYCNKVCEQAGVPLEVVPLTDAYWDRVVSHSIAEIKAGRTPNPDILCNSRVKFGAFLEHLEMAHAGRFDRVASGHYACVRRDADDNAILSATADAVKDQTYFLAHLTQAQLCRVMFPLAPLTKTGVRTLAAAAQLPTMARSDSQGICFLGKVRHEEFVREHLGEWPGPLIEEDTMKILGYHSGFWFHTTGQRKGILLSGGPWYVTRKDVDTNAVYISRQYHEPHRLRNGFRCGGFNWLDGQQPLVERLQHCKVRHGPGLYNCQVRYDEDGRHAIVAVDGQDQGVAPGQYAVFYSGNVCLGSAVVTEALDLPDGLDSRHCGAVSDGIEVEALLHPGGEPLHAAAEPLRDSHQVAEMETSDEPAAADHGGGDSKQLAHREAVVV